MRRKIPRALAIIMLLGSMLQVGVASGQALADREAKPRTILSDDALTDIVNALDLTRPELASAGIAWKQHDRGLAEGEVAQYFRTRTSVGWNSEAASASHLSGLSRSIADAAIGGRLQGGPGSLFYSFANNEIDWHFNATNHSSNQAPDNEWTWGLNRMSFWSDLSIAYRVTGDERYARTFVKELRSWIEQCPVPDQFDNGPGSTWRTIDAGIRAGHSWMDAFYAFRPSSAMSDGDILAMIQSLLEHGRYLRAHHTQMNWLTMEMSGLYSIGAVFPEFKDSAEWRKYSVNVLAEQARQQFLADGGQMELSTSYHNVALDNIIYIDSVAQWTGHSSDLPPDYTAQLERAYEWDVDIVAPNRQLPKLNDSGPIYLQNVMKRAAPLFADISIFEWFASNGYSGSPPRFTSVFLDRSGLAAMRSGWDTDANYLLFRVGPLGMGHQHQDSLGINVWAYGRELIFNSGGGPYEQSKWRQWAVSAFAHNTVVVDGLAQNRAINLGDPVHDPNMVSQGPINAHWKSTSEFDFASGDYTEGYGPSRLAIASQQRDVLFLKPDIFVVADRLRPRDSLPHRFQARWQILTTHSQIDPSTQALITEDSGVANIAVVPLLVSNLRVESFSGQEEPEILGWDFRRDEVPHLVPATTLLQTLSGSGDHLILTLLLPLRVGQTNPVTAVETGTDGVSSTVLFTDGRRLQVSCSPSRGIAVKETLADGKTGRSVSMGTL